VLCTSSSDTLQAEGPVAQVFQDLLHLDGHVGGGGAQAHGPAHEVLRHALGRVALLDEREEVRTRLLQEVQLRIDLLAHALHRHEALAQHEEVGRHLDAVLARAAHEITDETAELDVAQLLAQVLLRQERDLRLVGLAVDLLGGAPDGQQRIGDAAVVLAHGGDHQVDGLVAHLRREAAHHPEVHHSEDGVLGVPHHDDVPGVRVGVEEAVLEDLLHDDLDGAARDDLAAHAVADGLVDLVPVQVRQREHALAAAVAVHEREHHPAVALEVTPEHVAVVGLLHVVELRHDGAVELLHQADRVVEPRLGDAALHCARQPVEQVDVALDDLLAAAALHLDHHVHHAVRGLEGGAVHLADGGGGQRLLVEGLVDLGQVAAQLGFNLRADVFERGRGHVVLQLLELHDDLLGDQVRPGGHDLPELDEAGPEVLQHQPDALAQLGGVVAVLGGAGQEGPEPRALHHFAEAVARQDGHDLTQALEVTDGVQDAGHRGGSGGSMSQNLSPWAYFYCHEMIAKQSAGRPQSNYPRRFP
jgi:hypothetical protein